MRKLWISRSQVVKNQKNYSDNDLTMQMFVKLIKLVNIPLFDNYSFASNMQFFQFSVKFIFIFANYETAQNSYKIFGTLFRFTFEDTAPEDWRYIFLAMLPSPINFPLFCQIFVTITKPKSLFGAYLCSNLQNVNNNRKYFRFIFLPFFHNYLECSEKKLLKCCSSIIIIFVVKDYALRCLRSAKICDSFHLWWFSYSCKIHTQHQ